MYARSQEHTRENLHVRTKLARAENVCLILQAQLHPHLGALSGGSEIINTLSGIRKSELQGQSRAGGEPEANLRSRRQALNSLNPPRRQTRREAERQRRQR